MLERRERRKWIRDRIWGQVYPQTSRKRRDVIRLRQIQARIQLDLSWREAVNISNSYRSREIAVIKYHASIIDLTLKLYVLERLASKANFNPNQPRNPKRTHGAGRWRRDGVPPASGKGPRLTRNPRTPVKTGRLQLPPGMGHNRPPKSFIPKVSLPPPEIPPERPTRARQRTIVAKSVAKWVVKAAARRALGPIGLLFDLIEVIEWIQEYTPAIQSYFDDPLTLDELRANADEPKDGYELHHIVERSGAAREGFSPADINGYDNVVRVPTYKHHEMTTWIGERNVDYGNVSPCRYLVGKPWDEHVRVGLDGLRRSGVLAE